MFRHILTTLPIERSGNLNLHQKPDLIPILKDWSNFLGIDSDPFRIHIFYLSDILNWDRETDALRFEKLMFLLLTGRTKNQLAIIQIENKEQLEEITDSELHQVITINTELFTEFQFA